MGGGVGGERMNGLRGDGRRWDEPRPVRIERSYIKHAEGSVLVEVGDTRLICTATVEDKVPPFLKGTNKGWVTAEYGMLPRSTPERTPREASRGRQGGRTFEIQRLIGRSLRSVTLLGSLGERTIWLDCDVIQADGGTRTAAITGSFVALVDALQHLRSSGVLEYLPLTDFVAAISVGLVDGIPLLDLRYEEDSRAQVDMNVVMTAGGRLVEIQGTGEQAPFTQEEMEQMLRLAHSGIGMLVEVQRRVLGELAAEIGKVPAEVGEAHDQAGAGDEE